MSPTISAASKADVVAASPSPRRKILGERNENVAVLPSLRTPETDAVLLKKPTVVVSKDWSCRELRPGSELGFGSQDAPCCCGGGGECGEQMKEEGDEIKNQRSDVLRTFRISSASVSAAIFTPRNAAAPLLLLSCRSLPLTSSPLSASASVSSGLRSSLFAFLVSPVLGGSATMASPGRRDFVRDDGSDRTDRPPRGADAEGEMIEDNGESSSALSSTTSSHEAGRRAGVRGGLAESLADVLSGELDGHATIEGEHWVLRWLHIHCHTFHHGLVSSAFVQTGLLNFYAKCEKIAAARSVFDEIPDRNLFTWSSMISGYARMGTVNEAFGLFKEMQEARIAPNEVTMVSVISACAKAGALDLGRWVHTFVERKGIEVDLELGTALIDMYAKCGALGKAREVFDGMEVRDTMAWSSMIVGLAIHGHAEDALELFSKMLDCKVKPNHVTFIGVLSACAHSGIVSDGKRFWVTMHNLGIEPWMEHYGCMVDLLCRAGLLEEAYSFVTAMPILPNSVIWRTLLVGCKSDRTFDRSEIVAKQLLDMEPLNAENYVLLSNFYASRHQWDKVGYMRKRMKDLGVKVVPGCSSTEIDGFVHEFMVGDDSHPEIKQIREVLRDIAERVRQAGHEPWTSAVLHDVGEEEKEIALCEHSERLAIAYGMFKTEAPVVIRVVKNLRVCGDCHEVTKIISRIFDREIIVRDRVRFHQFKNGICSCNDFW